MRRRTNDIWGASPPRAPRAFARRGPFRPTPAASVARLAGRKDSCHMSDHFSGPRAIAGPLCDITDFYGFSSPERTGNLVLVTDVLPNAGPSAFFSDAVIYRFRIRP